MPGKKKAKKKVNAKESNVPNGNQKYTIEDYMKKAQESIDKFDYEMANRFCHKALEVQADNVQALELTGSVQMELGNMDAARKCYGRSVELQPDSGHLKYLYLGQLMEGNESLQCYKKAIEIMSQVVDQEDNLPSESGAGNDRRLTKKDISSAYLSIAELYMTDLCDENDAEENCVNSIHKAIESDNTNPEAYQVLADYHLVKDEIEEGKVQIKKSISLWLPEAKALVDDESKNISSKVTDPIDCMPLSQDSQLKAAKTLIEVELYNDATDVLELLLDQDDSSVDCWYLLGWANYLQGDDFKVTAKYYLSKCKEVAAKTKYDDEGVLEHMEELLQELANVKEEDPNDAEEDPASDDNDESEAMDQT